MPNQVRIQLREGLRASEQDVAGPFAVLAGPVILQWVIVKHRPLYRMHLEGNGIEHPRPVCLQLGISQSLDPLYVLHGNETVLSLSIAYLMLIQLPGEPFPSIQTTPQVEWEPRLQTHVHQSPLWM